MIVKQPCRYPDMIQQVQVTRLEVLNAKPHEAKDPQQHTVNINSKTPPQTATA